MRFTWLEVLVVVAVALFALAVFVLKAPRPRPPLPGSEVKRRDRPERLEPRVIPPSYMIPLTYAGSIIGFDLVILVTDWKTGFERGVDTHVLGGVFTALVLLYAWSAFRACKRLALFTDRLEWGELTIRAEDVAEIRATHVAPRLKRPEPILTLELRNPSSYVLTRSFYLLRRSRAHVVLCPSLLKVKPEELKTELFARYGAKAKLFAEW
jgi:hypothetical protein